MNKLNCIFLSFMGFFLLECKKENANCFTTTGKDEIEKRQITGFNSIKVNDKIDVFFSQSKDSSFRVEVMAGEHILPNIKTFVDGDFLVIENNSKCNFLRSYKRKISVHITAPHLIYIVNAGVGNFYTTDTIHENFVDYTIKNSGDINLKVNTKKIVGHMHGAGDVELSGIANEHLVNSTGQSFIRAENLFTGYSEIHYRSSGEARVYVAGLLDVSISASGNVYYRGNPNTVLVKNSGTGKLIKE